MVTSFQNAICLLFVLVMSASCGKSLPQQQYEKTDIDGPWVRSISEEGDFEGFSLEQDGRLRLINIFSMQGDSWSLEDKQLTLFTHTERYPQPMPVRYSVRFISEEKMILVRKDMEREYRRPASGTDLINTRWVASYVPGLPAEAVPEQDVYFHLREGGRLEGFAGCNRFSGSFTLYGRNLKIGPLLSTKMFCPAMTLEDNLYNALAETEEFMIVENQLYLYKGNALQGFFKAQQNP